MNAQISKRAPFKALPIAAGLMVLGMGVAGSAHAGAYAVAYNEITNFVITANPATTTPGAGSVNSNATACLPNTNCVTTGGAGVQDAAPAQIGGPGYVPQANNQFVPVGNLPGIDYARADAVIDSRQSEGDPFTRARAIAEGHLSSPTTANSNSGNSSGTLFTITFVADETSTFNFRFDADPFMQVSLQATSIVPSQADATMAVVLNLVNSGTGLTVFNWTPDGAAGGITGGTEVTDSFTLNTTRLALPGAIGPFTYDPVNCAPAAGLCFEANTFALDPGTYILNLSMTERVNLQKTVPEPGSLALAGLALGMLGFASRGKRKS